MPFGKYSGDEKAHSTTHFPATRSSSVSGIFGSSTDAIQPKNLVGKNADCADDDVISVYSENDNPAFSVNLVSHQRDKTAPRQQKRPLLDDGDVTSPKSNKKAPTKFTAPALLNLHENVASNVASKSNNNTTPSLPIVHQRKESSLDYPAPSLLELKPKRGYFRPSTTRIEKNKSNRPQAAAAFDGNKAQRSKFFASVRAAFDDVSDSAVGTSTRLSLLGPVVHSSVVKGAEAEADGNVMYTMSSAQLANERKYGQKRQLRLDLTDDLVDARTIGWVDKFNYEYGTDYTVVGISAEEVRAGATKAIHCNVCNLDLPRSIGLSGDFLRYCNKSGDTIFGYQHPLHFHRERCGAKCEHCGLTVEEYILKRGGDRYWKSHTKECGQWHKSLNDLVNLQEKYGMWDVSRNDKRLTSDEKPTLRWRAKQRETNVKKRLSEYQKKMLAETFTDW